MRRRVPIALLLAAALPAAGCWAAAVGVALGGAIYFTADESEVFDAPAPEVHAATVAALERLDLKLASDIARPDGAELEGMASDGRDLSIRIQEETAMQTRVGVRIGLTGDVAESARIRNEIRAGLAERGAGAPDAASGF